MMEVTETFQCNICKKFFSTKEWLEKHEKNHSKNFPREKCTRTYFKKESLYTHMKTHERPVAVDQCESPTRSQPLKRKTYLDEEIKYGKLKLSEHLRTHDRPVAVMFSQGQGTNLSQPIKKKTYSSSEEWESEDPKNSNKFSLKTHDGPEPLIFSQITNQSQPFENSEEEKSEGPKYSCSDCNLSFSNKGNLKRHQNSVAHLDKQGKSDILDRHSTQIHIEKKRTFQCDVCNFHFLSQGGLATHKKSHLRQNDISMFKCDVCNLSFLNQSGLVSHKKTHLKKKDVSTFQCNVCNSSFQTKNGLAIHKNTHLIKTSFKIRQQTHHQATTEKTHPYSCVQCCIGFSQKSDYNNHNLRYHKSATPNVIGQFVKCEPMIKQEIEDETRQVLDESAPCFEDPLQIVSDKNKDFESEMSLEMDVTNYDEPKDCEKQKFIVFRTHEVTQT